MSSKKKIICDINESQYQGLFSSYSRNIARTSFMNNGARLNSVLLNQDQASPFQSITSFHKLPRSTSKVTYLAFSLMKSAFPNIFGTIRPDCGNPGGGEGEETKLSWLGGFLLLPHLIINHKEIIRNFHIEIKCWAWTSLILSFHWLLPHTMLTDTGSVHTDPPRSLLLSIVYPLPEIQWLPLLPPSHSVWFCLLQHLIGSFVWSG